VICLVYDPLPYVSTLSSYTAISNTHVALVMIHIITPTDIGPSCSSIFLLNYNSQFSLRCTVMYSKPMHTTPKPDCLIKSVHTFLITSRSPHFTTFTLTDVVFQILKCPTVLLAEFKWKYNRKRHRSFQTICML